MFVSLYVSLGIHDTESMYVRLCVRECEFVSMKVGLCVRDTKSMFVSLCVRVFVFVSLFCRSRCS